MGLLLYPPYFHLHIHNFEDASLLILFFLTSISTGVLVDRARKNREMLIKREESTEALYEIVREMAASSSISETLKSVNERLSRFLKGSFEIVTKLLNNGLDLTNPPASLENEKEQSAAIWVFENSKEAGWSTDTLPMCKNLYIPLKGFHETIGILCYTPNQDKKTLTVEEKNFLYTVCQQLANFLERSFSEERNKQNEQLKQIDQIQRSVLDRVSQALQQPLITTQKALKDLKEQPIKNSALKKKIVDIENSSEFLMKTLSNISAMARLSDGIFPLNLEKHSIKDLLRECCEHFTKSAYGRLIILNVPENLPDIYFDYYLIEMLILNLLNNAIDNSPADTAVEIDAKPSNGFIVISVIDHGKGIPSDQLDAIFEKFYTVDSNTTQGVGLGLPIAKTIAEIHYGKLTVENLPTKGAKFSLFLPSEEYRQSGP